MMDLKHGTGKENDMIEYIKVTAYFVVITALVFFVNLTVYQFFSNPISLIVNTFFPNNTSIALQELLVNVARALLGIIAIVVTVAFIKMEKRKNRLSDFGVKFYKPISYADFFVGIFIAIAGLTPTIVVESIFGIITLNALLPLIFWPITIGITLVGIGYGEELIFRGYIFQKIEEKSNFIIGALISSLYFGLIHFIISSPTINLPTMLALSGSAAVIGFAFVLIYKFCDNNLWLAISIHGWWDIFLFLFQAEFKYDTYLIAIIEIIATLVGSAVLVGLSYAYSNYRRKIFHQIVPP